ncbi:MULTISPECIES: ImmA/IrrE family metallo-endopeptidase [Haloferax]|uniref:ImmA/IrrE family metallo-endopeptidase n=1 Tax=Haloferax marinum TaxID=2666143 RepID=A0A6A8G9L1_9EURY|nr:MULTISPECIES: ImmA/IrrE family metallo-endopeptidase [Haloferax]KAB1198179.1 ImmA/IrrE family metallo-endopeptidase [Haloferax sp. CBA1150]MRW97262.1 ImmA/IrrE family metallo-endopeptidase [Haloferax marinum]
MATTESTHRETSFSDRTTRDDEMHLVVDEWLADLTNDTELARESKVFKDWLDVQSRFHDYSARNSLLIALQCPNATRVAGYRTWQKEFKRQVSKGESAIWIWAPITAKACPVCGETKSRHDKDCSSDGVPYEEWTTQLLSFKPVPVFDISQTEGESLPELDTEARGDAGDLVDRLCSAADSLALDVNLVHPSDWTHGAARGVCEFPERGQPRIEVERRSNEADMATTLIHEFAHGLLHADRSNLPERAKREVEAEAVAYLVGRYVNLDVDNSAFYLAAWVGEDTDSVFERLNRIRSVAQSICDATIGVASND